MITQPITFTIISRSSPKPRRNDESSLWQEIPRPNTNESTNADITSTKVGILITNYGTRELSATAACLIAVSDSNDGNVSNPVKYESDAERKVAT